MRVVIDIAPSTRMQADGINDPHNADIDGITTSAEFIAAPVGYGQVSDVVQFKIYRDYTNASNKFTGTDPVNASQYLVNFDTHIEIYTLGSRQEYIK